MIPPSCTKATSTKTGNVRGRGSKIRKKWVQSTKYLFFSFITLYNLMRDLNIQLKIRLFHDKTICSAKKTGSWLGILRVELWMKMIYLKAANIAMLPCWDEESLRLNYGIFSKLFVIFNYKIYMIKYINFISSPTKKVMARFLWPRIPSAWPRIPTYSG